MIGVFFMWMQFAHLLQWDSFEPDTRVGTLNCGVVMKNARKHVGVKRKLVGVGILGSCRDVAEEISSVGG